MKISFNVMRVLEVRWFSKIRLLDIYKMFLGNAIIFLELLSNYISGVIHIHVLRLVPLKISV